MIWRRTPPEAERPPPPAWLAWGAMTDAKLYAAGQGTERRVGPERRRERRSGQDRRVFP